jgi:xanthine/CO dehydrogenase XdhC/CoxF family maturation factor
LKTRAEHSVSGDVLDTAQEWLDAGRGVALGTVVKTWGSAPRPAGSQIAVRDDGAFVGSVSGGCVEGAVIEAAQAAIQNGQQRKLEFGVSDEQAWAVGLACGGRIEILVEPIQ